MIKFLLFGLASLCQNGKVYLFSNAKLGIQGSVAEWSKALVLGTSPFGGVGSNPTAAICFFYKVTDSPILSSQIELFFSFFTFLFLLSLSFH